MECLYEVAKQIQAIEETAIAVHYLAHCHDLCLQDTAKKYTRCLGLSFFKYVSSLNSLPRDHWFFSICKQDVSIGGTWLRPLCPTRWAVQNVALESILSNYAVLLEAFERISSKQL